MAAAQKAPLNPAVLSVRLLALLETIPDRANKQKVHGLRTTVRRLEAQLPNNSKKLAKSLKALRKKAGKVRDIDVHLGILKDPLVPSPHRSRANSATRDDAGKSQDKLRQILKSDRKHQSKTLRDLVSTEAPLLKKRLPAVAEEASKQQPDAQEIHQLCARARKQFLQWTRSVPADEARLHRLRINTKMLRYSLEPVEQFEEAAELASHFKQVQDAIGFWHDWATLSQIAERELTAKAAAPVCSALQAATRREFRKALRAAQSVHTWMTKAAASHPRSSSLRLVRKAG